MHRARILAAAVLAAGFAIAPAKAATILQDGNFDDPLASGTFQTFNGGSFFGNGNVWQVLGGSIDEIGNYWSAPPAGGGSVDLDGTAPGGISQAFTVGAGTYKLSFYLSGNPDGGVSTKSVTVSVGSISNQLFTYDVTGTNSRADMDYVLESLIFTSSGGGDILSFLSQDQNSPFGPVVGGIAIAAVPEPASWALLILGFAGIGVMLRGRRRLASLAA